jgi:hypothetical protein
LDIDFRLGRRRVDYPSNNAAVKAVPCWGYPGRWVGKLAKKVNSSAKPKTSDHIENMRKGEIHDEI